MLALEATQYRLSLCMLYLFTVSPYEALTSVTRNSAAVYVCRRYVIMC